MSMMEDVVWEEENASPRRGSRAFGRTPCRREVGGGGGGEQLRRIQWDRFLPTRSLRVLLVENDDSTRHIVAALLRKCSYHVAAVADGLKAWEVMKGKSYSFDLVLTEFEVPSLSGIGLLGKIVGTEDCKNIPVIMMSSQDSVGIVHKCMLKGAVDFLVKPLRKNELRNLWQHVWRRHCSNTYACTSENNAASNQISSNVGDWSHTGDTSDKGSDSDETLGGKLDKKVDISRKQAEPVLSKDGQFHRETEAHLEQPQNNTNTIALSLVMDDNAALRDKTLVIEDVAAQPIQMALLVENSGHISHEDAKAGNEKPNLNHQIHSEEFARSSDGLAKSLANGQCSHPILKTAVMDEGLSTGADRSQIKHGVNSSSLPLWELSLMTKLNGCVQNHAKQNTILKHSNVSAFSRYGGTSTSGACKPNSSSICIKNKEYIDQTTHVSCRGTDNVEPSASRVEVVEKFQIYSDRNMEEDTAGHSQLGFTPMPIPVGAVSYPSFCMGYGEPIIHQDNPLIVQSFSAAGNGQCRTYSDSHSGSIEFRCHDLNHPLPCRGQVDDTEAGEELGLSSSPTEEVYKNGSSSRDVLKCSGSNDSDDTMGDAAAAMGAGRESGNENGFQNFVKNGLSSDLSHREAAIIKFRLKRKDRCFAKKVRYHSRQKLAEQRPRVKGQFVSKRS
ncbi:two-component response regulator-like APRR3 isoform X2 [Phalaenopsis equestris]|uniref:two-component response regulator-like APRR3 isoform X2 n=1 Tax=Phalaenopsis equestris TaxID=78828 RepID=UPI0009E21783|nr:two-component response regulator-like APRR3 isoform X2 [Phalaenopsis equestris]